MSRRFVVARRDVRLRIVDEAKLIDLAWEMHSGDSEPVDRHYVASNKSVRLEGYGLFGCTFSDTSNWSRSRAAASTFHSSVTAGVERRVAR